MSIRLLVFALSDLLRDCRGESEKGIGVWGKGEAEKVGRLPSPNIAGQYIIYGLFLLLLFSAGCLFFLCVGV
jgi:hypothetical protein